MYGVSGIVSSVDESCQNVAKRASACQILIVLYRVEHDDRAITFVHEVLWTVTFVASLLCVD